MAWIPDVSRTLVILKRLERQEDLLKDSTELFQAFFEDVHSPEQFARRMEELGELLSESQGYYVDPEVAAAVETAVRGPSAGARLVIDTDVVRLGRRLRAHIGSLREVSSEAIQELYPRSSVSTIQQILEAFPRQSNPGRAGDIGEAGPHIRSKMWGLPSATAD